MIHLGGSIMWLLPSNVHQKLRLNLSPGEHEKTSLFPHLQHLTESTQLRKKTKKNNLRIMKQTKRPNLKLGEMMLNSHQA